MTGFPIVDFLLALREFFAIYTAYDPYCHDYHRWDADETVYYNQWVTQNHIDSHRDYRHLSKEDQKRYRDWRHSNEHDRGRDHDHR